MLFVVLLLQNKLGDSSIEKLIQKFCFQFYLVQKTGTRKLLPVFWYQFSVPVSGACVFGITTDEVTNKSKIENLSENIQVLLIGL